jgi:hypothetical protein
MAWTGENRMPAYLELCLETVRKYNAKDFEIILITPDNLTHYLTDIHPAYQYLSYVHRADYIRCEILHQRGGIYLDMDTICFRNLQRWYDKIQDYDIVNYDGRPWGEIFGISVFGPTRRHSVLTRAWSEEMRKHLDKRLSDLISFRKMTPDPAKDCLQWAEILHDILVPVAKKIAKNKQLSFYRIGLKNFSVIKLEKYFYALNQPLSVRPETDILILNNAEYSSEFKNLSKEELLTSDWGIASLIRDALEVTATSKD